MEDEQKKKISKEEKKKKVPFKKGYVPSPTKPCKGYVPSDPKRESQTTPKKESKSK